MINKFRYGFDKLTIELALKLAKGQIKGEITDEVKSKILKCFDAVKSIVQGDRLVYSINTGFGSLCSTKISAEETKKLQKKLLKSHSVGLGYPIEKEISKLMLILKVHTLCLGYSGISLQVIERICWHIDNDHLPLVPEQGSVGASGDLAPLAHLFLPLIGLGYLTKDGISYHESEKILKEHKLEPIELHAKEGLALINGTQFIAAFAIKIAERF